MSWSDDQKTPLRFEQNAAAAKKLTPHPAKAVMDQRWEERRARSAPPPAEPTASGIQIRALTPSERRMPPPISHAALANSRPAVRNEPAPAADSGRHGAAPAETALREPALLGNPQQALLVIALGASALLLALLYFGGFLH